MIPCSARNLLQIIMFQIHVQNYFTRCREMVSRQLISLEVFQKNGSRSESGLLLIKEGLCNPGSFAAR